MRIGAIVQARVSSTRLPGKILKELPYGSGITVLEQVIRRLKRSKKINKIIVATSVEKNCDAVVNIIKKEQVICFRGSEKNVLSRYYLSARQNNLDIIIRITSDCPCIDSKIVDLIIEKHLQTKADYTSNTLKRTYPRGLDAEVFNSDILEEAYKMAKKDYEMEHVTSYIYKRPNTYKIEQVKSPQELYAPELRITLDTDEDYALLCAIFEYLYPNNKYFTSFDVINLFKEKRWLKLINKRVIQKNIFDYNGLDKPDHFTLKDELKEIIKIADLQGLKRAKNLICKHLSK